MILGAYLFKSTEFKVTSSSTALRQFIHNWQLASNFTDYSMANFNSIILTSLYCYYIAAKIWPQSGQQPCTQYFTLKVAPSLEPVIGTMKSLNNQLISIWTPLICWSGKKKKGYPSLQINCWLCLFSPLSNFLQPCYSRSVHNPYRPGAGDLTKIRIQLSKFEYNCI